MELRPDHQFDPFGPDAAAYDDPKFDVDSIDWSDPTAFFKAMDAGQPGAMPMPEIKTPAEVRREARARLDKIFASYETLHEILRRHKGTIQKRWFKKTRAQRLKVLLTAWPNMPTIHRPDFAAFRRESELDRCSGTKYREHLMWPYVNQEDLLNPKVLPLLPNARGRHDPSHFAAADVDAMHLGFVTKAVVPIFLNGHVMILNGVAGNRRDYGKLMAWEEHPDAFNWMTKQKQFIPGEGLMILEAQERLLTFLVQCCLELLHDIPQAAAEARTPQVKKGEADLSASYQPLSTIYTDLPSTKVEVARPKAKVKTRGTPRPVAKSPTEAEPVLQPNPIDPQPTFAVDARALKVFRTIFFNPAVTSTPGEIPWNDFLHAMTSVGFTVMKLYGSVWQFQPTKLDVERSIQFHEPHPRGKIPFTTARRYGRRLHRAYGWFGEMFTLSAK